MTLEIHLDGYKSAICSAIIMNELFFVVIWLRQGLPRTTNLMAASIDNHYTIVIILANRSLRPSSQA